METLSVIFIIFCSVTSGPVISCPVTSVHVTSTPVISGLVISLRVIFLLSAIIVAHWSIRGSTCIFLDLYSRNGFAL